MSYKEKYLKYKTKYMHLKQFGGGDDIIDDKNDIIIRYTINKLLDYYNNTSNENEIKISIKNSINSESLNFDNHNYIGMFPILRHICENLDDFKLISNDSNVVDKNFKQIISGPGHINPGINASNYDYDSSDLLYFMNVYEDKDENKKNNDKILKYLITNYKFYIKKTAIETKIR
jgi:hypothetical protein